MKTNLRLLTRTALALALFVLAAGAQAARAQGTLTGTWTGSFGDKYAEKKWGKKHEKSDESDWEKDNEKRDGLHLSLERRSDRGGRRPRRALSTSSGSDGSRGWPT